MKSYSVPLLLLSLVVFFNTTTHAFPGIELESKSLQYTPFISPSLSPWIESQTFLNIYKTTSSHYKIHSTFIHRYDQKEEYIEGIYKKNVAPHWDTTFSFGMSLENVLLPQYKTQLTINYTHQSTQWTILDTSFSQYRTVNIGCIGAGVMHHFSDKAWASLKTGIQQSDHIPKVSILYSTTYLPINKLRYRLDAGRYSRFDRNLVYNILSTSITISYKSSPLFQYDLSYSSEYRNIGPDRQYVTLCLTYFHKATKMSFD